MLTRKLTAFTAFAAMVMCMVPTISKADGPSSGDKKFVMQAAQGGMTEVASSKAALATTQNEELKKFAQMMVDDHTKANDELKTIATSKSIEVPGTLDSKHEGMVDKLKGMTGADFDTAYVKMMLNDHKKTVDMFEKAAEKVDDADIKAFAAKTLPALQEHYTMVKGLAAKMNIETDKDSHEGHDMGGMDHDKK